MRERVNIINGSTSILLVAPHGPSDSNTALIAEMAAANTNAYAVINQGFERGDKVDPENDIADCNRVDHCQSEIIFDEFLKPLIKIKNKLTKRLNPMSTIDEPDKKVLIIYIHGAGDIVHKEANEQVDVIVGYGLGNVKDSITCKPWRKNLFLDSWRDFAEIGGAVYEGSGSGRYAGRSSNNMNQYFRKHDFDNQVDSLQLEFPYSMRKTESLATVTAMTLSLVLNETMKMNSYSQKPPKPKLI